MVVTAISAAMIARGMVLLWILDLVTGGGNGVQSDEGEEDGGRSRGDSGEAGIPESGEVVGGERGERDRDEQRQHTHLDDHHDGVDRGGLAGTADQQQRTHRDEQDIAGRLTMPGVSPMAPRSANAVSELEQVVQQLVQIAAPADRGRGHGDAVLEKQTRGHAHSHHFAHRRVGV